ncbi:hypothetical protein WJX72_009787 [[Myrmecia] bisecta]|uniref:Uncharacterized protein n=1 Tax=[Myrmecia] bisecta TaxID=41462 RepID=A0AAW1R9P7_9CHLO
MSRVLPSRNCAMATRARVTRSSSKAAKPSTEVEEAPVVRKRAPAVRKAAKAALGDVTNQATPAPQAEAAVKVSSAVKAATPEAARSGAPAYYDASKQKSTLEEMLNSPTDTNATPSPEPCSVAESAHASSMKASSVTPTSKQPAPVDDAVPSLQTLASPGRWAMEDTMHVPEVQVSAPSTGRRLKSVAVKPSLPPAGPTTNLAAVREPHPEAVSDDDDDISRDLSDGDVSFSDLEELEEEEIQSAYNPPEPQEVAVAATLEADLEAAKAQPDDICDALDSLSIGQTVPLVGVPVPAGKHIRFTDEGEAMDSPGQGKALLRGVPPPSGTHIRFDD